MLSAARSAVRATSALPYAFQATRGMSMQGVKGFNEHEQVSTAVSSSTPDQEHLSVGY
jgi:hypothetical protein